LNEVWTISRNFVFSQESGTRSERGNAGEKLGLALSEGVVGEAEGSDEVAAHPEMNTNDIKIDNAYFNIKHLLIMVEPECLIVVLL